MQFVRSDVKLVLAGKGPDERALRDRIQRLGLQEKVRIEIFPPDERLFELYLGALGVCYPAYDEDYGYVTLEAFAAERPVVTTADAGGPLEFVTDGETGLWPSPMPGPSPRPSTACTATATPRRGWGVPATRCCVTSFRGGPTSSRGCWTDAPQGAATRRQARARAAADRLAGGTTADTVAFAGPMPPAPSGIATYDRAVLDGLRRIGFTDRRPIETIWPVDPRYHAAIANYRVGVYQLGNNVEHHLDVYRLAWAFPGLVVLHDLAMDDFVRGLQASGDLLGIVAMREALGAHRSLEASGLEVDGPLRVPWSAAIARHARGVVVHAPFARRYLEAYGCRTPIYVVPHPPVEAPVAIRAAEARAASLRAPAGARGARSLVVAAGDLNGAKQLGAVADAVARLDHDVHLAVVGRRVGRTTPSRSSDAASWVIASVHVDVSDEDFLGWLAAADVVVDLRYPHRGEVSGTLARAMQIGRATVISATGAYLDEPEGSVATIPAGPADPAELAEVFRELADRPERRARIAEAARAHMARLRETDATARGYAEAIETTAALVHDPVDAPMARWARALVEIGVGEEQPRPRLGREVREGARELQTNAMSVARPPRPPLLDSAPA